MLVFYENASWVTDDISPRTATELRESQPKKWILLKRESDGFKKTVMLGELKFEYEY